MATRWIREECRWSSGLRRWLTPAWLSIAALPLSGCSFLFVDGPPDHPERVSRQSELRCTTSKAAPIIDTVIAGYQVIRTGAAVAASDSTYDGAPISRGADIGLGLGFMALFGASAAYGYVVTGDCKDAKARQGTSEDTLPPPAYGPREQEVWSTPPDAPSAAPASAPAQAESSSAPPAELEPSSEPAPAERICSPGVTQECVGPGGCRGGQACLPDGMLWSPCDCGTGSEAGGEH